MALQARRSQQAAGAVSNYKQVNRSIEPDAKTQRRSHTSSHFSMTDGVFICLSQTKPPSFDRWETIKEQQTSAACFSGVLCWTCSHQQHWHTPHIHTTAANSEMTPLEVSRHFQPTFFFLAQNVLNLITLSYVWCWALNFRLSVSPKS